MTKIPDRFAHLTIMAEIYPIIMRANLKSTK